MNKLIYERPIITRINAGIPDKFGMRSRTKALDKIDGVPVEEIAGQFGTPVFVISEKTIRDRYREAYRAFSTRYPKVKFAWSYKTNYLDTVCRIYHHEGSWAEVVSGFEYEKALQNGVDGKRILFNGPDKQEHEIERAIVNGSFLHIDHFDELYLTIDIARRLNLKARVAIRINMDTGIYPMWDRFGFNYENGEAWSAICRIMLQENLELSGLHTHIGTYIMTPGAYAVAAQKLALLAIKTKQKYNHAIKYIDMGGGFASKNTLKGAYLSGNDTCPSFDQYAEAITSALISSDLDPADLPTLFLETGRALIDDAGYLLGKVKANKSLSDGRKAIVLDFGINNLFTSLWYNHNIYPAKVRSQSSEATTIYGPLCMNIDVVRDVLQFPPIEVNDFVVVERVGAYNMTQWMQFITYRPNVVLIDLEGNLHLIRKREDLDTFNRQEIVPEKYKVNYSNRN
jgi:diaminopimelate decarboxylase